MRFVSSVGILYVTGIYCFMTGSAAVCCDQTHQVKVVWTNKTPAKSEGTASQELEGGTCLSHPFLRCWRVGDTSPFYAIELWRQPVRNHLNSFPQHRNPAEMISTLPQHQRTCPAKPCGNLSGNISNPCQNYSRTAPKGLRTALIDRLAPDIAGTLSKHDRSPTSAMTESAQEPNQTSESLASSCPRSSLSLLA